MKFNLSVIATLLCLTLALSHPACAAGEATIDCSTTPDRCQVLPDLCNSLEAPDLGIIGDGTNVSVGSTFSASGGRPPYEVGVSNGVTLGYSDSGVTVSSIPTCVESATLTMIDATEQTETKELNFFSQPLAISGPNVFAANAPYMATGGCEPYIFTVGGGLSLTTSDNTATIADDPVCVEAATLTVRDFCQHTVEKEIQFPSQPLVITGPAVAAVSAQYAATGGHPLFTFTVSNGVTLTTSGSTATIAAVPACTKTATLTVEDGCHLSATKEIQFPTQPLVVNGPTSNVAVGSTFSASGGKAPYSFSVSKGAINSSTGAITATSCSSSGSAAYVTVTVTDACGKTANMVARYVTGHWQGIWSKGTMGTSKYRVLNRNDCGLNMFTNWCNGSELITDAALITVCSNPPHTGGTVTGDDLGGFRYIANGWRLRPAAQNPDLIVDSAKGLHITFSSLSMRYDWFGDPWWSSLGWGNGKTNGENNFPCGDIIFDTPVAENMQYQEWVCN